MWFHSNPGRSEKDPLFEWNPNEEQLLRFHAKVGLKLYETRQSGRAIGHDIALKLADNTSEQLHSELARAHSEYFSSILKRCKVPLMADVSQFNPYAVRETVEFMYSGKINVSLRELPPILVVANALKIPSLRRMLEDFVAQKSADRTVLVHCMNLVSLRVLDISQRTKDSVLKEAVTHFEHLLVSGEFLELEIEAFENLMDRDDLPVGREVDLFRIVTHYFLNSNKYKDPARPLGFIRYDQMDADDKLEIARLANHFKDAYFSAAVEQYLADSHWRVPDTEVKGTGHQRAKRGTGKSFEQALNTMRKVPTMRVQQREGNYGIAIKQTPQVRTRRLTNRSQHR